MYLCSPLKTTWLYGDSGKTIGSSARSVASLMRADKMRSVFLSEQERERERGGGRFCGQWSRRRTGAQLSNRKGEGCKSCSSGHFVSEGIVYSLSIAIRLQFSSLRWIWNSDFRPTKPLLNTICVNVIYVGVDYRKCLMKSLGTFKVIRYVQLTNMSNKSVLRYRLVNSRCACNGASSKDTDRRGRVSMQGREGGWRDGG